MTDLDELWYLLDKLSNFNLIHYTGHYVLTFDRGMGKPIVFEGDSLVDIRDKLKNWVRSYFEEGEL
jgi:hypothetical protein